jgi:alpha-tubulin suppressor-like RCC1 family protein
MKNQNENDDTADVEDDIILPRRVALHCSVWPSQNDTIQSNFPPHGIFEIAASVEHSAALVRRPTGDIEVYTWGNATLGALGVPIETNSTSTSKHSADHKKSASHASSIAANSIFPLPTVVESLTYRSHKQMSGFPRGLTLGPYSSFVLLSNGKCMSFGYSAVGMLGHAYGVTHSMKPKELFCPNQGFVSVSAGAFHVVAVTENGEAHSWGINSDDRLGLGTGEFASKVRQHDDNGNSKKNNSSSVGIEWVPQHVECPDSMSPVIRACAGYDCSMIVTRSGEVYSFGRRSGKLGKGELVADVAVPQPLYGGLRLFHNSASNPKADVRLKKKTGIQRVDSEGNLNLHCLKKQDI